MTLGDMPKTIRDLVRRLVADARPAQPEIDERLNGYLLTGGPAGCSFLDAEGNVWLWSAWDDSVELVADGPLKVGMVALAAERVPELSAWLPRRPAGAPDCGPCGGTGRMPAPWPQLQCPECNGMGWTKNASFVE